jgi:transposase
MPRVEVITRGERRRVWTLEQKREIVSESLGSALTPTEVARKHGISSGLLYGWRQKLRKRRTADGVRFDLTIGAYADPAIRLLG